MHRIYKAPNGINYSGVVDIDNTVVMKEKPISEILGDQSPEEQQISEIERRIQNEINNRISQLEADFALKEKRLEEGNDVTRANILEQAKTTAQKVLNDAVLEGEKLKEQAKKEGFDEGFIAGKNSASEYFSSKFTAIDTLLQEIENSKQQLYLKHENEVMDLAFSITEKVICAEMKADREVIFTIIKQALKTFRNSPFVKISVAECDFSKNVNFDDKFLKDLAGNIPEIEIELLSDAKSGTVILDNDNEIIDASIPNQLELLAEILNSNKNQINNSNSERSD